MFFFFVLPHRQILTHPMTGVVASPFLIGFAGLSGSPSVCTSHSWMSHQILFLGKQMNTPVSEWIGSKNTITPA